MQDYDAQMCFKPNVPYFLSVGGKMTLRQLTHFSDLIFFLIVLIVIDVRNMILYRIDKSYKSE